jgi:hypothetical protein
MAATTSGGSSSRSRSRKGSSANGSKASSSARATTRRAATRGRSQSPASRATTRSNGNSARKVSTSRGSKPATRSARKPSARAPRNDSRNSHGARQAITNFVVPVASATLGVAGGVLLGRTRMQRTRKVLGIPLPGKQVALADVTKQIGEAGRQFGKLAGEVRTAREKAEKISRAIS